MTALSEAFVEMGYCCYIFRGEDEPLDYSDYDIIIIDTYWVTDEYIAELSKHKFVVCIDDNALYNYSCDVLLNYCYNASELNFRFGEKKPKLLLGGRYALLRKQFRAATSITPRKIAGRIFVCFGGTDMRNFTLPTIKMLRTIENVELSVVIGVGVEYTDELRAENYGNVAIYQNPENISEVMTSCDIAITSASTITFELAALGISTLVITMADNQENTARFLDDGYMKCLGNWQEFDYSTLIPAVTELLSNYNRRISESEKSKKLADKNGAYNAANAILEVYNGIYRIRNANN
jgi:spore coat polysaccharide biosynthesis predicted glycosyltransferase SpsG